MASWRSIPLFIARFIPIVLILTLSFFWIQEIRERTSIKQELESTTERLLEAENRIQETTSELERARQEAQEAKAETRYLVEQLMPTPIMGIASTRPAPRKKVTCSLGASSG